MLVDNRSYDFHYKRTLLQQVFKEKLSTLVSSQLVRKSVLQ